MSERAQSKLLIVEHGSSLKKFFFERAKVLNFEIYVAAQRFPAWLKGIVAEEHFISCDPYDPYDLIAAVFASYNLLTPRTGLKRELAHPTK